MEQEYRLLNETISEKEIHHRAHRVHREEFYLGKEQKIKEKILGLEIKYEKRIKIKRIGTLIWDDEN